MTEEVIVMMGNQRKRYARGEISKEEFERMKKDIL